jgi:hypothetical protein
LENVMTRDSQKAQGVKMPNSEMPTLDDAKAGNVSEEWQEYFEQTTRKLEQNFQRIVENTPVWRAEAKAIFSALHGTDLAQAEKYISEHPPSAGAIAFLILLAQDKFKSDQAARAANAAHSMHRSKYREIREVWAAGNFATREVCADQEYGDLGISRETARKYLRGTPDPNPWPAKRKPKRIA